MEYITDLSNILGKLKNPNALVDTLNFDILPNMINSGVYISLKSMLSVPPGKKCCIIKSMRFIIEFKFKLQKM